MTNQLKIKVEANGLPSAELQRLLDEARADGEGIEVDVTGQEHRGLDPAVATALITGAVTLLGPFLTKIAEKLFAKDPDAKVKLRGETDTEITAETPAGTRRELVNRAITVGDIHVTIIPGAAAT